MKQVLLFFQIDALRHDYINKLNSPFIYSLAEKATSGSLIPAFGFEPDAAYLAGLSPQEANIGSQYYFTKKSPFKLTRHIPASFDRMPEVPNKIFRKILSLVLRKFSGNPLLSVAMVPFNLLHFF